MPAFNQAYKDEHEPQHGCFRIMANEDQMLSKKWARRLIIMIKIMEYDEHINALARDEVIRRIAEHMRIAQDFELGSGQNNSHLFVSWFHLFVFQTRNQLSLFLYYCIYRSRQLFK